jgi:transposase
MVHVGIDLHQKTCFLHALDDQTGEICLDQDLPSERQALLDCLTPLRERGKRRLIIEACGFAGYWWDQLDPLGEVVAVHPKHVKEYKGNKRKNDRRDAAFLVALSQLNRLPRAYLGTTAERDLKDLLRYRVGLVRIQTRLRVRLRNVAQRYGAVLAASDVDSRKARRLWQEWPLRETHRLIVDQLLSVLDEIGHRRAVVEEQILAAARPDRRVQLLDTLPGLDYFGALLAAVEIGDWQRFYSGDAVACFAGLVPRESASGGHIQRGKITKEGSPYLRWIMVQAALHADKSPRLKRRQERVAKRRGPMQARVAVAREMLVIAWHMLRADQPDEERAPRESRARPESSGQPERPLTH